MTPDLPPLPDYAPEFRPRWPDDPGGFTADQLRTYAAEAVRVARIQALEDAALLLDEAAGRLLAPKRVSQVDAHTADILQSKAAAIRALPPSE